MNATLVTNCKAEELSLDPLMVPFLTTHFWTESGLSPRLVYGRFGDDFASDCLLYQAGSITTLTEDHIEALRSTGTSVCYAYDRLDFDNREFTRSGYRAVYSDMRRASSMGFTHVLLANPYLIEMVSNEFGDCLKIIISSQLDFNSARAHILLEALNHAESVTHVVVSQCQLEQGHFADMARAFKGLQLIVEVDRWLSDTRIVNDRYYNVIYGLASDAANTEARRLTLDSSLRNLLRPVKPFLLDQSLELVYKVGEINAPATIVTANARAVLTGSFSEIAIVDLHCWGIPPSSGFIAS